MGSYIRCVEWGVGRALISLYNMDVKEFEEFVIACSFLFVQ